jgi:hypothetical protein
MEELELAEQKDGYRAACASNELNAVARRGQRYSPFFVQATIAQNVSAIAAKIQLLDDVNIVILDPTADNGYPHTRPGLVCIPAGAAASANIETTLIHESIHIHQRDHRDMWRTALSREGWTPLTIGSIPFSVKERCRINPDTMATPFWAWEGVHVPLPLFSQTSSPRLSDIVIKWMDVRNGALYSETPSSFTKRYGTPPQPEHPYELLAVEMAEAGIRTLSDLERKLQSL